MPGDQEDETTFEYRFRWSASSNISFKGATDWTVYDGFEDTAEKVEEALTDGEVGVEGLSMVIDASGFEWYVEVRPFQGEGS